MLKIFSNKGYSLSEIVITVAIATLALSIILAIYFMTTQAYRAGNDRAEVAQNGRVTMDRMIREIRQANEISTELPETGDNPENPPPSEIMFEDGHNTAFIQYIKYYLDNPELRRQIIIYYFEEEPEIYVHWNDLDGEGNPPTLEVLEDKVVGEFITELKFYGTSLINISENLTKRNNNFYITTKVLGRNLR